MNNTLSNSANLMMMWWFWISIKHMNNHLGLTFNIKIFLLMSSQQHHDHVMYDHLGEEEGEEGGLNNDYSRRQKEACNDGGGNHTYSHGFDLF